MAAEIYYQAGSGEFGPMSVEEFAILYESEQIGKTALVKATKDGNWYEAFRVYERLCTHRSKQDKPKLSVANERQRESAGVLGLTPLETISHSSNDNSGHARKVIQNSTEREYPALRLIIEIYRVIFWIGIVVFVFAILKSISDDSFGNSLPALIAIALGSLLTLATAEGIRLGLDVEDNTRRSADLLASILSALEYSSKERR